MKVAILASDNGSKALYIHQFFKEGNRVEVDCLITDRENSPLAEDFSREGIPTYYYAENEWQTGEEIVRLLRERGAEIILVDDLDCPVPPAVTEAYGEAVISPSGVEESPSEVVALYNKLTKGKDEKKKEDRKEKGENPTMEEEWAEALKIHYDEEEAREAAAKASPPPYEENQGQAQQPSEPEGVAPVPPQTPPQPNGGFWQNGLFPGRQPENAPQQSEPMPNTYLIWSVLATIFCCLIPGIVAIIMSSSVSTKYFNGDIEGAKRASRRAEIWIIVSIVCGIIWFSLYLPLMFISQ